MLRVKKSELIFGVILLVGASIAATSVIDTAMRADPPPQVVFTSSCKYSALEVRTKWYESVWKSSTIKVERAEKELKTLRADLESSVEFMTSLCSDPELPISIKNRCTDWQNERSK